MVGSRFAFDASLIYHFYPSVGRGRGGSQMRKPSSLKRVAEGRVMPCFFMARSYELGARSFAGVGGHAGGSSTADPDLISCFYPLPPEGGQGG